MGVEVLQEVTEWPDQTPNHSYVIKNGKCVAYRRQGANEWHLHNKPLQFSKTGRKFTKIKGDVAEGFGVIYGDQA
jgi:hypothetical protein